MPDAYCTTGAHVIMGHSMVIFKDETVITYHYGDRKKGVQLSLENVKRGRGYIER